VAGLVACAAPTQLQTTDPDYIDEPLTNLPSEVEELLDEGFVVGANLPWLHYGHDFGEAWGKRGVREEIERHTDDFDDLIGADVVRWFVYADGRALDRSTPDMILEDLEAALEVADDRGIKLMPVLFDFKWFDLGKVVDGVQVFGRRELAVDPELRAELIARWIAPLGVRFRDDPRIFAFEIINEPEWALYDGPREPIVGDPVSLAQMEDFVFDVAGALRGGRPLTVGSAAFDDLDLLWVGSALDLLQLHHYEDAELPPADELRTGLPVLVGEFASAEHDIAERHETYGRLGYAGALPWSLNGQDPASSRRAIADYFGN